MCHPAAAVAKTHPSETYSYYIIYIYICCCRWYAELFLSFRYGAIVKKIVKNHIKSIGWRFVKWWWYSNNVHGKIFFAYSTSVDDRHIFTSEINCVIECVVRSIRAYTTVVLYLTQKFFFFLKTLVFLK